MSTLIICGGAPGGLTAGVCGTIRDRLGGSAPVFYAGGYGHCTGCGSCASGGCVLDDGMDEVIDGFLSSDSIVLASPIRFSGPSSMLKTAMDRFQPLWYSHPEQGARRLFLLLTAGSDSPRTEYTEGIVRAFCASTGCTYSGCWLIPGTDRDDSTASADAVINDLVSSIQSPP